MLSSDHQGNQGHWAHRERNRVQREGGVSSHRNERVLGKETCQVKRLWFGVAERYPGRASASACASFSFQENEPLSSTRKMIVQE